MKSPKSWISKSRKSSKKSKISEFSKKHPCRTSQRSCVPNLVILRWLEVGQKSDQLKRWKEERKKERRAETFLAQIGKFENLISPEPDGVSTRSKRLWNLQGEIFSHTKFRHPESPARASNKAPKMGLWRFWPVVYIVQLRFAVFFFVWGGDRYRGRTIQFGEKLLS